MTIYFDYYYKSNDGSLIIGEKLCRSHAHAEKKRQEYEKKYGKEINAIYFKKVVTNKGKTIYGF